jgi:hypothetical protein
MTVIDSGQMSRHVFIFGGALALDFILFYFGWTHA